MIDPDHVPAAVVLVGCTEDLLSDAGLVVVLTDHDAIDWPMVRRYADHVLDTRNRLEACAADRL
jgi:UDP-N-acetyl-D-mannosaminuronic acid dehydrogenase/UDP-N-acetyl-D-glucosamine dehydrogenase